MGVVRRRLCAGGQVAGSRAAAGGDAIAVVRLVRGVSRGRRARVWRPGGSVDRGAQAAGRARGVSRRRDPGEGTSVRGGFLPGEPDLRLRRGVRRLADRCLCADAPPLERGLGRGGAASRRVVAVAQPRAILPAEQGPDRGQADEGHRAAPRRPRGRPRRSRSARRRPEAARGESDDRRPVTQRFGAGGGGGERRGARFVRGRELPDGAPTGEPGDRDLARGRRRGGRVGDVIPVRVDHRGAQDGGNGGAQGTRARAAGGLYRIDGVDRSERRCGVQCAHPDARDRGKFKHCAIGARVGACGR